MPGVAIRLDAELMSKGPQRQSDSHSQRRPPTGADQLQTAALQFRRLSNSDAPARPHRSPSLLRNASTRWYPPAGCPLAATNVCSNACRIREPTLPRLFRGSPTSAGPGPTEREPRSHCFDVTHQVRARAAKRARHRRGHIFCPRRMEAGAAKWGQLVLRRLPGMQCSFSRPRRRRARTRRWSVPWWLRRDGRRRCDARSRTRAMDPRR
jgi:hypothetical protein